MKKFSKEKRITNRDSESINKYFNEIKKKDFKKLTAEEEVELTKRIKQGDDVARNILVNSNLKFVISVAKAYQGLGLPLNDLISEGNIGLIKAATKFDETKGFKFISYAVWWIRQSILQSISENSRQIRLPMNQVNSISKVNKALNLLEQQLGRIPSTREVAEHLDMDEAEVDAILFCNKDISSLDTPINDEESSTLEDVIPHNSRSDESLIKDSLSHDVRAILEKYLNKRDAEVVQLLFGIGCEETSMDSVANKFGLTRERIRQIKVGAIRKIQSDSKLMNTLKTYL